MDKIKNMRKKKGKQITPVQPSSKKNLLCPRYGNEEVYVMYIYVALQEKQTFKNRKKSCKVHIHTPETRDCLLEIITL